MPGWVVHVCTNQLVDVSIQRRAEQQPLSAGAGLIQDLLHDLGEAHIGHLVCFVQHSNRDLGQVDVAAID